MKSFLKFATRLDNLVLVVCLCLFAGVIAYGENGPTPKIVVGSSGISDGSVTPAKLSGPIPVANGGTGATTAAAGLAALGGASLNGSSTVDFLAEDISALGFLSVGTGSPKIKMKKFSGNLSGAAGGVTGFEHGIASLSKVLGSYAYVSSGTLGVPPAYTAYAGYLYNVTVDGTYIVFENAESPNSDTILGWPCRGVIIYEE